MRFEVIFRQQPFGQQLSRCVEADSFNDAATQAVNELVALGRLNDEDGMPLPVSIRRIER